ncbi:hypothetical protein AOQ84DRAFT_414431 [Glonium stellatum]|uniref:Uncharacterized protein n=1 Tax=Glonium stellatum TaxID=574774 RepID=A0A8E2FAC3_9PEZI|nr:hypothetical protein AOQ84DRAFT_414431 [Glonium stellatum]
MYQRVEYTKYPSSGWSLDALETYRGISPGTESEFGRYTPAIRVWRSKTQRQILSQHDIQRTPVQDPYLSLQDLGRSLGPAASDMKVLKHSVDGPGRLLEIATFRRSQIPDSKFKETFDTVMRISSQLPILRQILVGGMSSGERMSVIIADWTSAEEKDVVEPTEAYQVVKAPFAKLVDTIDPSFTCYHTILPGTALTPEAGGYVVSVLKVPSSKQGDLSAAFARYLATVPEDSRPAFMAIAVSREDNEAVVNFSGYPSKDAAQAAMGVRHTLHVILPKIDMKS